VQVLDVSILSEGLEHIVFLGLFMHAGHYDDPALNGTSGSALRLILFQAFKFASLSGVSIVILSSTAFHLSSTWL